VLDPRRLLLGLFGSALKAVQGREAVQRALEVRPIETPATLIALGKAAGSMTRGACDAMGDLVRGGLLVSKPGHLDRGQLARCGLEILTGGHPIPTQGSLEAGRRLLTVLESSPHRGLVFLISGGTSSLVEVPIDGLGLPELERLNHWLLASGLPIGAINLVRKAVSRVKGGGLLAWLGGRQTRVLAISDVPGDDPGSIGSGLLVPEPDLTVRLAALDLPPWLAAWVERGLAERAETPHRGPPIELVATLDMAKEAAAAAARSLGVAVRLHERFLQGDAAECGRHLARVLMGGPPCLHLWGGETTVRLPPHPGRGGRNQHLALAAAMELAGRGDCLLLSAGTDGTDGPTEDAGALVDGQTLARARDEGFDPRETLAKADAGSLLAATGDLVHTGPTGTNVMDVILGLKRAATS